IGDKEKRRNELHQKWVKSKHKKITKGKKYSHNDQFLEKDVKEYEGLVKDIERYKHLKYKKTGFYLLKAYNILLKIYARAIAFSTHFERDNCFYAEVKNKEISGN